MASSNNTKRRKGLISEEDIASLLKRYSAPTILAVLKEVAQFPDVKIDWNVLVTKSATGISNAWEYQMLWRHLAYCSVLPETVEEKPEPLDDDSDLEYELETFPPASDEASLEAAACVKVLLASGLPDDAGGPATVEAPLTINIPSLQDSKSPSDNPQPSRINITFPVSVQKQSSPAVTTAEGLDGTGPSAGSQPARRKRKPWTLEEDNELIAAVKKLGERNWANILKADFKGDRTASQLSQRWSIIRKRNSANLETVGGSGSQSELTEQQLATRRAVSIALNMPMNSSLSAACAVEAATGSSQQIPLQTALSLPKGTSSVTTKPRGTTKKAASVVPNPMIQAAAVAAGARIATPSTAKSLLKAAQSKSAVHISTIGKSSIPGVTPPLTPNNSGTRPNVHYICTGLSPAMKDKVPLVSAVTSASTLCGTTAAGKKTNGVTSVVVGNSSKEEKVQSSPNEDEVKNSPKEVVKTSSIDSEIKNSSNEEGVKNSSNEQPVKPEEMEIDCAADIAKYGKQQDQAALPDPDMVIEDVMTQNLSKLPDEEAAVSDPMQLDNHHIENEKEN
ncbi:hypothetical protein C5167_014500 [Papaver somniferum]|uniref:Uncharacterized protein n=1 Tax=Papaver somniferum TaxID=3469 RepID=A0A4Y7J598_PAPSO|nr:uncharacterized protein LOC113357599 isoform X1 [Papaver somniferum]RZC55636.1 hypothetical protein C5167_014500 [Papaver somniferum]